MENIIGQFRSISDFWKVSGDRRINMGYLIMQPQSHFRIRSENKQKVFEATKGIGGKVILSHRKESEDLATGAVSSDPPLYLIQLNGSEWQLFEDNIGKGDIVEISCLGEMLGDNSLLFDVMAPFVEAGSYLAIIDESDYCKRWYFDGSSVIEQHEAYVRDFNETDVHIDKHLYAPARMVYGKGMLFYKLGEYSEAINCFNEAISLAPDFVDAYFSRGRAFFNIGKTRRAVKDYVHALRLEGYGNDFFGVGNVTRKRSGMRKIDGC
jgi:tetratricopeptide (TPR) repeat protein